MPYHRESVNGSGVTHAAIRVVDLHLNRPTVDAARRRLIADIESARRDGIVVIKVIHGYGSSGVGGRLRSAVRRSVTHRKRQGLVVAAVAGENWSIVDPTARRILEGVPDLARDRDLDRGNPGVTFLLLASDSIPNPGPGKNGRESGQQRDVR